MRVLLLLTTAVTLLANTSSAHACSCMAPRMSRQTIPADGADMFPVDGTIRVFLTAFPPSIASALGQEYRLVDARSQQIPLTVTAVGRRIDLKPIQPLVAGARYTLERVFAYNSQGQALSDDERLQSQGMSIRGAWYPALTFQTAGRTLPLTQRAPTVSEGQLGFRFGGGDCGPGVSLHAQLQISRHTRDTDIIELHVRGQGIVESQPAGHATAVYAGNMSCNPDPVTLRAPRSLRYKVVTLDASGNEVGTTGWLAPSGAPPRGRGWQRGAMPAAPDLARQWSNIQMVQPAAATLSGPPACAHGFEAIDQPDVASTGAPTGYAGRATLSTSRRGGWLAFRTSETTGPTRLVRIRRRRGVQVLNPRDLQHGASGVPEALVAGRNGAFMISRTYANRTSTAAVHAFDESGGARWSQDLPGTGGDAYRIAVGGGVAFAAWGTRNGTFQRHLSYGLFNARTGAVLTPLTHTAFGIHTGSSEAPAIAFAGGRFILAWTSTPGGMRAGPLRSMVVSTTGVATARSTLAMEGAGIPDMAGAGARAALVNSNDGEIQWALLDRDGHITRGPTVVSTGVGGRDNRSPRVAWNGSVFAVAWETNPRGGVFVAAVDTQGRTSPITRVDGNQPHASTVGIASWGNNFLMTFGAGRGGALLKRLQCRTNPPAQAPNSIAPVR